METIYLYIKTNTFEKTLDSFKFCIKMEQIYYPILSFTHTGALTTIGINQQRVSNILFRNEITTPIKAVDFNSWCFFKR